MLLKKQENNNVTKAIYSSSNICASTYDKTSKDLTIIFNNGGQYRYSNVSETDYTRFELADSQGVIFNSHIKTYTFEKMDKVNPSAILLEVTELKDAEKKIKAQYVTNSMITAINAVSVYYEKTESIDPALYAKMKSAMDDYEKITASAAASIVND
jgi:hypothetical protein